MVGYPSCHGGSCDREFYHPNSDHWRDPGGVARAFPGRMAPPEGCWEGVAFIEGDACGLRLGSGFSGYNRLGDDRLLADLGLGVIAISLKKGETHATYR